VQEALFTLIGSETVVFTRPFFGWRVALLLMVVGVMALFAAWGQLPLLLTQAQARSTVATLVTQIFVVPNPATSTLTLSVLAHEKPFTFMACAWASPKKAVNASIAMAATAAHLARSKDMASPPQKGSPDG
jgi:hypothetical protein